MPRIAFYFEGRSGIGHFARGAQLCRGLAGESGFSVGLVTGSPELFPYPIPGAVEQVHNLPAVPYQHLVPDAGDRLRLTIARISRIRDFIQRWKPDCLIVDHFPVGVNGELLSLFNTAAQERWKTRFAFGAAYAEGVAQSSAHLARVYKKYSITIGFNDPEFDPILDRLPMFPNVEHRGYVGVTAPQPSAYVPRQQHDDCKRVLVTGGGGFRDAQGFFDLVVNSCKPLLRQKKIKLNFIAGPLAAKISYAFSDPGLAGVSVQALGRAEDCMARADMVIGRCGYNTAFTAVQGTVPLVFIPVPGIDFEQVQRARRLARLDRVWNVEEDTPTPTRITLAAAILAAFNAPVAPRRLPFQTDAPARLAAFLKQVL